MTTKAELESKVNEQAEEIVRLRQACIEMSRTISHIDYLMGPPNEMNCSLYDVDVSEERVVAAVGRMAAQLQLLTDMPALISG